MSRKPFLKELFHPNQLVWVSDKEGRNKKSFWPAVILNEEEWTNVPTHLKSCSSEEKLIWKLRTNAKLAMSKVLASELCDFIGSFHEIFQRDAKIKSSYQKAVIDGAQVACLLHKPNFCVTDKNLVSTMSELTKNKSAIIISKKSQWKIIIPKNMHDELVEPFYSDSEEEQNDVDEAEDGTDCCQQDESFLQDKGELEENAIEEMSVCRFEPMSTETESHTEICNDIMSEGSSGSKLSAKETLVVRLDRDRKFAHKFKKNVYVCFLCPMKGPNMNEMLNHVSTHYPDDGCDSDIEDEHGNTGYVSCSYCPFESTNSLVVMKHMRVHFQSCEL